MWIKHRLTRGLLRVALSLALAGAALGAPSPKPAEAATLVVDRNDDIGATACTGAPTDCTLRGAIEIANTNGVTDTITFDGDRAIVLTGNLQVTGPGTTIRATSPQSVTINANQENSNVFTIAADDITLEGLRLFGAGSNNATIWITNDAQRVRIANNVIGDDVYASGGCGQSPTSHSGIFIDSDANPTGSDAVAWIYGNVIKCNGGTPGHGIHIFGANEVVIGADALGNAGPTQINYIESNAGDGVRIQASPSDLGADDNTLRNSYLQDNNGHGLVINDSLLNLVYGNVVQFNGLNGIELRNGAQGNQIGCPLDTLDPNADVTLRNIVEQNTLNGIRVTGAGTNNNEIFCNWIGTADGDNAFPNFGNGVQIDGGASFNWVGAANGTGNVISGNDLNGVLLTGAGTNDNIVRGNFIGTNAAGTSAIPNQADGLALGAGASSNIIGGSDLEHINLIAGNTLNGVTLSGAQTTSNTVILNDIGYNSFNSLPIPNGAHGLVLADTTHHNIIGGANQENYVAFNGDNGLALLNNAYDNLISVNSIFNNALNGVLLDGSIAGNTITRTIIHHNGLDGIASTSSTIFKLVQEVSIYANGGLGIDTDADDPSANTVTGPVPTITSVNTGTGEIEGLSSADAIVEVYLAYPDVSRHGEGQTFVGTTTANGSGEWSLFVSPGENGCYTAMQTTTLATFAVSSEFGPNTCLQLFIPIALR